MGLSDKRRKTRASLKNSPTDSYISKAGLPAWKNCPSIFHKKVGHFWAALHECITCQTKHVLIAKKVENCKKNLRKNHESSVLKFWWTNYRFGRQNSNDTRVTQMFIVLRFWSLSCSRWLHFSLRWISNIAHRSTPRNRLPCEPWNYRPFHQLLMTWSPKTDDWVEFDIHWPIWSFSLNVDYNSQKPKKNLVYRSTITNPHKSRVLSNHEISPIIYLFTTQKNNLTRHVTDILQGAPKTTQCLKNSINVPFQDRCTMSLFPNNFLIVCHLKYAAVRLV